MYLTDIIIKLLGVFAPVIVVYVFILIFFDIVVRGFRGQ